MLIKCPECKKEISSLADSCPNCGLPSKYFNSKNNEQIKPKQESKKRTRHKLPNRYGFIKKLSGNRANPYAVYPPTNEYTPKGNAKYGEAIDYCRTYNEAYKALVKWHEDGRKKKERCYTFTEVYNMWMKEFLETHTSKSTIQVYQSAYKKSGSLYNRPMKEIVANDMQVLLDDEKYGYSLTVQLKSLFSLMFKYAIRNGMADKNYAEYIVIRKENNNEQGIPFSEEELKLLWNNRDRYSIAILLILVYTGLRVNELSITDINLPERHMIGGLKTSKGKTRIVPIKEEIVPLYGFVDMFRSETYDSYRKKLRKDMRELGIYDINDGKSHHTTHDARHTFSFLADKYGVEEICKYAIMGHSYGKDVDKTVYTHREIEQLKEEVKKIPIIK